VGSKLPVWVYIQGGGYVSNSNANYNGSTVVATSGQNIVFVNFNYRVASWGFLASEKVRGDGDLNAGLLDQRFALKWVQDHIEQVLHLQFLAMFMLTFTSLEEIPITWLSMEFLLVLAQSPCI
jgi:hypothetical protein